MSSLCEQIYPFGLILCLKAKLIKKLGTVFALYPSMTNKIQFLILILCCITVADASAQVPGIQNVLDIKNIVAIEPEPDSTNEFLQKVIPTDMPASSNSEKDIAKRVLKQTRRSILRSQFVRQDIIKNTKSELKKEVKDTLKLMNTMVTSDKKNNAALDSNEEVEKTRMQLAAGAKEPEIKAISSEESSSIPVVENKIILPHQIHEKKENDFKVNIDPLKQRARVKYNGFVKLSSVYQAENKDLSLELSEKIFTDYELLFKHDTNSEYSSMQIRWSWDPLDFY